MCQQWTCSLKADVESVSSKISQELWHSLNLDKTVLVHIEVVPGVLELLRHNLGSRFWQVSFADLS